MFHLLSSNFLGSGPFPRCLVIVMNAFLLPFLLVGWSLSIYVVPCLQSIITALCCRVLFFCCGESCMTYTDSSFPANDANAGKTGVKWLRLHDVTSPETDKAGEAAKKPTTVTHLFNGIAPSDIAQGQLGDCWLLAGLATLAERPELIQNAFHTKQFNPRGKYTIRLYNTKKQAFEYINIDDYIPCDQSGTPIYTNIKGNEMWPLLLEKAFAKSRGGYKALEGGLPLDAMQTITGFRGSRISVSPSESTQLFHSLRKHFDKGCILACGSKGEDKTREQGRESVKGSVVGGHAYSILGMYEPLLSTEKVQLLKLRNPWGSFEWKGDWSDKSPTWDTYSGVALEIGRPPDLDDGIFYINWRDFCSLYDLVDILFPETAVGDLHITIHEDLGLCGAPVGCALGCASYWCACRGPYALLAAKSSIELQKEMERDFKLISTK